MSTGAVVLCAGPGSRYGPSREHKLLAPFRGQCVAYWAVEHALAARLDATIMVSGSVDVSSVLPPGALMVENERWVQGLAISLRESTRIARDLGLGAIVVGLGDQPLITPQAWRSVAASASLIAVATYSGVRGHPVKLGSAVWDELPSSGEEGARSLIRRRSDVVRGPLFGRPFDIDTAEDLMEAVRR